MGAGTARPCRGPGRGAWAGRGGNAAQGSGRVHGARGFCSATRANEARGFPLQGPQLLGSAGLGKSQLPSLRGEAGAPPGDRGDQGPRRRCWGCSPISLGACGAERGPGRTGGSWTERPGSPTPAPASPRPGHPDKVPVVPRDTPPPGPQSHHGVRPTRPKRLELISERAKMRG